LSPATSTDEPIHIVLRYAGALLGIDETVAAHQAMIRREDAVLFGKLGRPLGSALVSRINKQSEDGTRNHLFLVARDRAEFVVSRGLIRNVALEVSDAALIPPYYRELGITRSMGAWFELTELQAARPDVLKKLAVAASGNPISSIVGSSRASMFIARLMPGKRLD
jgi:hypothetical protein